LAVQLMSVSGRSVADLVGAQRAAFPVSGEINRTVKDPDVVLAAVESAYLPGNERVDRVDGLGVEYAGWRFNLRKSNTEPVLRLNVEARGDAALMRSKTAELLSFIDRVDWPDNAYPSTNV